MIIAHRTMPAPAASWNRMLSVVGCTDWSCWMRIHWKASRGFCCAMHSCTFRWSSLLNTQVLAEPGTSYSPPLPRPPHLPPLSSPSSSSGTFLSCFLVFFLLRMFISVASRLLYAWGHIQRATQRSPFRLREAPFIVLPGRGNQIPL